jgi:hypothetical protein
LVNLGADATYEEVAKRGHFTQDQRRPVLRWPVCLGQRCENDIPFVHGAYSGLGSWTMEGV